MRSSKRLELATAIGGTSEIKAQYAPEELPLRVVLSGGEELQGTTVQDGDVSDLTLTVRIVVRSSGAEIQDVLDAAIEDVRSRLPVGFYTESVSEPDLELGKAWVQGEALITVLTQIP